MRGEPAPAVPPRMPPTPSRRRGGGLPSLGLVQLLIGLPPLALLLTTLWYYRWHTLEHEASALSPAALGQPRDLLLDSHQVEEWVARRRSQIVEWSLAHQREHAEHQAHVARRPRRGRDRGALDAAASASRICSVCSPPATRTRPVRAQRARPAARAGGGAAALRSGRGALRADRRAPRPRPRAPSARRAAGAAGVVGDGRCGPDGIVALTYGRTAGATTACRSVDGDPEPRAAARSAGRRGRGSRRLTAALTAVRALRATASSRPRTRTTAVHRGAAAGGASSTRCRRARPRRSSSAASAAAGRR